MEITSPKKKLLYDNTCATCRVMKTAAEKTVSNYDFIEASSDEGKKIAAEKNLNLEKSAYLIDCERIVSHSDMALEVMHDVRVLGPFLTALARIIPRRGRERMYEWLVKHRIR